MTAGLGCWRAEPRIYTGYSDSGPRLLRVSGSHDPRNGRRNGDKKSAPHITCRVPAWRGMAGPRHGQVCEAHKNYLTIPLCVRLPRSNAKPTPSYYTVFACGQAMYTGRLQWAAGVPGGASPFSRGRVSVACGVSSPHTSARPALRPRCQSPCRGRPESLAGTRGDIARHGSASSPHGRPLPQRRGQ